MVHHTHIKSELLAASMQLKHSHDQLSVLCHLRGALLLLQLLLRVMKAHLNGVKLK